MAVKTGSKDLSSLQSRFKKGYTLKHTGGGHYRVLNARGEYVEHNGKVLSLSGTAHGGRALNNIEAQLKSAGVFKGEQSERRQRNAVSTEERARKAEQMRVAGAERSRVAAERSDKLRERLADVLIPVGGPEMPGVQADVAYIASQITRQNDNPVTVDLLAPTLSRLFNDGNISNKYMGALEAVADRLEQAEDVQETFFELVREARGLPQQVVPTKDRKGSLDEADWPFEMRLLPLEALFADGRYQRPPHWQFVRRSAASFDERLVGAIDVSERSRGATFAVLDGQQRMEMMKLVGKKTVWAAVYSGFDVNEEARFFLHKNRDKKAIHPYYTYRAKLTSGDPETAAITKIVESFGYKVSVVSAAHGEENISAISSLEEAYRRKNPDGAETLTQTLRTLKASTFGRPSGQNTNMIRGVSYLFAFFRDEELDLEHLHERIGERGVPWMVGAAREGQVGNSLMGSLTRVLIQEYNRGLPRNEKLNVQRIPALGRK